MLVKNRNFGQKIQFDLDLKNFSKDNVTFLETCIISIKNKNFKKFLKKI